jgi:hypothetical protein
MPARTPAASGDSGQVRRSTRHTVNRQTIPQDKNYKGKGKEKDLKKRVASTEPAEKKQASKKGRSRYIDPFASGDVLNPMTTHLGSSSYPSNTFDA